MVIFFKRVEAHWLKLHRIRFSWHRIHLCNVHTAVKCRPTINKLICDRKDLSASVVDLCRHEVGNFPVECCRRAGRARQRGQQHPHFRQRKGANYDYVNLPPKMHAPLPSLLPSSFSSKLKTLTKSQHDLLAPSYEYRIAGVTHLPLANILNYFQYCRCAP